MRSHFFDRTAPPPAYPAWDALRALGRRRLDDMSADAVLGVWGKPGQPEERRPDVVMPAQVVQQGLADAPEPELGWFDARLGVGRRVPDGKWNGPVRGAFGVWTVARRDGS